MKLVEADFDMTDAALLGNLAEAMASETDQKRKDAMSVAFWATCLVHNIKFGKDVLEGDRVDTMPLRRLLEESAEFLKKHGQPV
jgi:hypothetical protein